MTPNDLADWAMSIFFSVVIVGCGVFLVVWLAVGLWQASRRDS